MIYLEEIEVVGNDFPGAQVLNKDFKITCSDVNLLVGDQGCGKSTLLHLIQKNHPNIKVKCSDFVIKNGVETFYFDSEKDNPRINNPERYTNVNGTSIGYGYSNALVSRFKSHGEILQDLIVEPLMKVKDCVILLDEPESGLSLTNQFKMIKAIKKAVKNNCQFFIATHCYPLIESFNVISLEHSKQMSGIEFINKIKG